MKINAERKHIAPQIIRSGLWGAVPGFTLSLIISFVVGLLLFSSGFSDDIQFLDRVYSLLLFTALYGLGITGVPSGMLGMVTGLITGLIMSRTKKKLSDYDAGEIGVAVSGAISITFFVVVAIRDTLFSAMFLLIPALIYVLASYFMASFVYRRVFVPGLVDNQGDVA